MIRYFQFTLLSVLLFLLTSTGMYSPQGTNTSNSKILAGYLYPGERQITESEIDASLVTHLIYAFADIKDGKIADIYPTDGHNIAVLTSLRGKHPHLKVMVAVGGWTGSGGFSDMALTQHSRGVFITSVVDYLKKHQLDGVDLDWEYPGLPGHGNTHRPEDKVNFTLLLSELRSALNSAARDGHPYLLTIAAGAFKDYIDNVQIEEIAPLLDFVNLMTYDFTGEWSQITGHHANLLLPPQSTEDNTCVEEVVQLFTEAGLAKDKIVIGAAFYGRGWRSVLPGRNGFSQSGVGLTGADLSYNNLVREFIPDIRFEQHWDHRARAAFLWNPDDSIFISYESPRSMREKARYVHDNDLKGVMFWQYFSDYENQLLKALSEGLRVRR